MPPNLTCAQSPPAPPAPPFFFFFFFFCQIPAGATGAAIAALDTVIINVAALTTRSASATPTDDRRTMLSHLTPMIVRALFVLLIWAPG